MPEAGVTPANLDPYWQGYNAALNDAEQALTSGRMSPHWFSVVREKFKLARRDPPDREHVTDGSPCWCNPEVVVVEGNIKWPTAMQQDAIIKGGPPDA